MNFRYGVDFVPESDIRRNLLWVLEIFWLCKSNYWVVNYEPDIFWIIEEVVTLASKFGKDLDVE